MSITRRDIERAHTMVRRQQSMAERDQAKKERYVGQITQSLEVGAGALASGLIAGRYGALSLGPVPLDLLTALGLYALGFSGVMGKFTEDTHNIGDGVFASYLVKLGAGLGTQWRISAGQSPFTTSGNDPGYAYGAPGQMNDGYGGYGSAWNQGGGLSNQDLAAMAAMA